jgi:xylulokinase
MADSSSLVTGAAMDAFLGIDLGTSSVKALVVDETGRVRGTGRAEYPVHRPRPDHAEQDPEDWWRATQAAVRQATGWGGADVAIVGVGLSGQMHGTVLLDAEDKVLAPAIIWADQRTGKQVASITERVGAERLVEIAGSPVAAGFQAATIRWLQEERASLWWRTRRVLLPKDELRRRLVGTVATDPSDGAGTLLLDARWRDWSPEILDALEIEVDRLPPVQESTAVAGELRAGVAEELGLAPGLPVVVGAGDAAAGLLGAGILDPATLFLSLSTGAQVMVPARGVHPDPGGRTHTFCAALEPSPEHAGWYQMGATLATGMAMRWLREQVFDLRGEGTDDRIATWAGEAPIGAAGLLFLPYLAGERTPHMDPNARGAFLGLTARHGRAELARAAMEGATFACLDAFAVLQEQGAAPDRIVVAGGGARSPVWRQMVADVFALPVHALATTDQAAMGAALLAATGVRGVDPIATAREWADYGPALEPNRASHAHYGEVVALFREAYERVNGLSHRLAALDAPPQGRVIPRRPRR